MKEIAPGIVLFNNVFMNAREYVKAIEDSGISWRPAEVLASQDENSSTTNYRARDTDLIMLPPLSDLEENSGPLANFSKEFYKNILPLVEEYKNFYHAKTEKMESPQLLRYEKSQHFHDHVDDHPFFTRRISMTFYINNDYEGGDIEFSRFGIRIKAEPGQLLIFPSNFIYNHKVHQVTSGKRYVVVQWMA